MALPQELEVWYILPAIRKEFAARMIDRGMKQKDIAEKLGLTEAAISQYVKNKRASEIKFDVKIKNEINRAVGRVIKGSSILEEIQKICHMVKQEKVLCEVHKKYGKPPKNCKVCLC